MKQIKAVIQPDKLQDVRDALKELSCYRGAMISDIMGQGIQQGITQAWRGEKFQMDLIPKVMIDLVVKDEDLDSVINVIIEKARTGEIGDGKIFVYNVEEVVRVRTGEKGEAAI